MAHLRPSRPDYGLGFQVKVLVEICELFPVRSEAGFEARCWSEARWCNFQGLQTERPHEIMKASRINKTFESVLNGSL